VRDAKIKGVAEICPANASYHGEVRPDQIKPDDLLTELKRMDTAAEKSEPVIATRIIESRCSQRSLTHETLMRFRARHQDPNGHRSRIRGALNKSRRRRFISSRHIPVRHGSVSMVDSSPACLPLPDVERQRQLQARNISPAHRHAQAHGRAWRLFQLHLLGARRRRLQMFGITPMPIYDPIRRSAICVTSCGCSSRATREVETDRPVGL